jgi:hypothetical protein
MKRFASLMLVSAGLAFASPAAFALGDCKTTNCSTTGGNGGTTRVSAPEIDASSGARAIAVLIAGLLLVGEGLRRRG